MGLLSSELLFVLGFFNCYDTLRLIFVCIGAATASANVSDSTFDLQFALEGDDPTKSIIFGDPLSLCCLSLVPIYYDLSRL